MDSPKIFEKLGARRPKKSGFDLSRETKFTGKMGELIPVFVEEVLPTDSYKVQTESLIRLAPMFAPLMHRVNAYMHYFFVPNRLIWNEFETFIAGGRLGTSEPSYPVINMKDDYHALYNNRLADYLGLPQLDAPPTHNLPDISLLPFRAYQLIWNEYFRDETLHQPVNIFNISNNLFSLKKRAWEKDYFTSALPFTQRGDEVAVPLTPEYLEPTKVVTSAGTPAANVDLNTDSNGNLSGSGGVPNALRIENLEGMDLTINNLRTVSALQRFLEKQARGGYRYIETLLNQFGIKSQDARLQRPEYLGGGKQNIKISEVLNTTGTEEAPQGDMAGHGISAGVTNSFKYNVPEHGYIIGIFSVLPRTNYQQGIPRHWSRRTKYDYYWPELANLGEQEIKNKELFMAPNSVTYNESTFGYQQRYAEYKYGLSSVHGEFRDTLSYWHLGRIFANNPQLNAQFVEANVDSDRIFPVQGEDHLWIQMYHNVKARRPMPFFSNPQLR